MDYINVRETNTRYSLRKLSLSYRCIVIDCCFQ